MKTKMSVFAAGILFCCFSACASVPEQAAPKNTPEVKPAAPNIVFVEKIQSALESGDIDRAIRLFDTEMPESLRNDVDLEILKASLLLSADRTEEASAVANRLLQSDPSNQDVLELSAEIAIASSNKQSQTTIINQLLKADPNNATANIIQGNQQALKKKYKLALKNYQRALISEPDNQDALFGYAQMCYYTNDINTSRETFNRLLQENPENSLAWQYLGKLAAEDENYKAATEYIQKAIELEPERYDFYIDLGQYMRNRGQFAEAEKAWSKAIEIDPTYFLGYTYRAGLYDEQNRIKEALKDYHKIIETNPKYYFAYEEIGILEFHEQNWQVARQAFLKAESIRSSSAYQMMIMITYMKEKKLLDAKNYAQKCMKTMNRESLDYKIMRLLHDQGPINAENAIIKDLDKETDKNKRGKMMFYFAMYYQLKGMDKIANEYFAKITQMQTPLFFEYRLAEWALLQN